MKLWSLQSLRFWAALAVVHAHAVHRAVERTGTTGMLGSHGLDILGRAGVDVFFVISGVIIARTAPGMTGSQFIVRRLCRILPLYLLLMLPWIVFGGVAGALTWRNLLATFLFWPATDRITEPLVPVTWTISFELLFYGCAALVLWRRRMLYGILAFYALALAIRQGPWLQFLGNPISIEFLLGIALAYAPRFWPLVWAIPFGVAAIVLGAVLHWPPYGSIGDFIAGEWGWTRLLLLGVPAVGIVAGVLQLDVRPGFTTYLGDASYALYLVHPLVLMFLALALRALPIVPSPDVIILVGMGASILAAWRCHELFEKPIAAFFRRPAQSELATA
jgi:exopolysaccharide production protein ExoZ